MIVDNLFLDNENLIKIPQNSDVSFNIFLSKLIENAVQIDVFYLKFVNVLNLYLIIKSFLCNLKYISDKLLIVVSNEEGVFFVVDNLNPVFFKNISFNNFYLWFHEKLLEDWKYLDNSKFYSFVITYQKGTYLTETLSILKPVYPWKEEILIKIIKIIEKEENFLNVIEVQKKKIEEQNQKIEEYEKEINNLKKQTKNK